MLTPHINRHSRHQRSRKEIQTLTTRIARFPPQDQRQGTCVKYEWKATDPFLKKLPELIAAETKKQATEKAEA